MVRKVRSVLLIRKRAAGIDLLRLQIPRVLIVEVHGKAMRHALLHTHGQFIKVRARPWYELLVDARILWVGLKQCELRNS